MAFYSLCTKKLNYSKDINRFGVPFTGFSNLPAVTVVTLFGTPDGNFLFYQCKFLQMSLRFFAVVVAVFLMIGTANAVSVKEVEVINGSIVVYFDVTPFEMMKFLLFGCEELKYYVENFVQNATPYKVGYFSAYLQPESEIIKFAEPVLIRLNESVYLLSDTLYIKHERRL